MAEEIRKQEKEPNRLVVWLKNLVWDVKWLLLWVAAFAVVGIIIQSMRTGGLVFIDFFGGNFIEWINSFGNFSSAIVVTSQDSLWGMVLRDWYYFLYAGGLFSLAWEIIAFVFRSIFRRNKSQQTQQKTMNELEERFVEGQQA